MNSSQARFRMPAGPVTNGLVIANLLVAAVLLIPGWWEHAVMAGGLFPARFGVGNGQFADVPGLVPAFLTPLTSAFLHGGLAHVLLNMMMLLLLGKFVERALGSALYAGLYVIGAYVASLAEWIAAPQSMMPVIGASGAISAIVGAYVLLYPNKQPQPIGPIPASIARPLHLLLGWVLINLGMRFVGPDIGLSIAIWAHIGGFAAGLLLARPLLLWRFRKA